MTVSIDGHDRSFTTANRPTNAELGMVGLDTDVNALCCVMNNGLMQSVAGHQATATIAAAGTNQGTAAALRGGTANLVTAADGTKGVLLPTITIGDEIRVTNPSGSALLVYPSGTNTIAGGGAGASVSIPANGYGIFFGGQSTNWTYLATGSTGSATTTSALTGTASPFPITGLAAAQGGAVTITGGASSTSGNAGGAVNHVGGAGGATGAGGAINNTGAAGGATSGVGGAVVNTGGAGTAGNSAGGSSSNIGGAGQGSAAGGAAVMTGGAGGATGAGGAITVTSGAGGGTSGAAGAINIAVGSATNGAGAAVTITAGNGAAGTSAGGMINLVPGTAVSTGAVGEVQVNGNSSWIYKTESLSATDASRPIFIATRPMILKTVSYQHTTGSTSGTLQIEKLTGTTAAGSGTVLLTGTIDLSTTTVANTTTNGTLIATVASLKLATGDRVSIKIAGTMTGLANAIVVLGFAPQ